MAGDMAPNGSGSLAQRCSKSIIYYLPDLVRFRQRVRELGGSTLSMGSTIRRYGTAEPALNAVGPAPVAGGWGAEALAVAPTCS